LEDHALTADVADRVGVPCRANARAENCTSRTWAKFKITAN
jgi:hypothetical protein